MNPLLATLLRPFTKTAAEGEPTEGPWYVHKPDGWLPSEVGQWWNYWQMGYDPVGGTGGSSAVVEACVSAYAQTIAQCPGDHWRGLPNGGRERVTTSALSRLLRYPNDYQSRSDFILNLVRNLYYEGNSYHLALRNDRFEASSLHPFDPKRSKPVISPDGDVFYNLAGNNVIEPIVRPRERQPYLVPARDVFHVKLEAEAGQPLLGVPPLRHASLAVAAQNAIGSSLINFFAKQSRPLGVIETEQNLSKDQVKTLRDRWNEASRGMNAGGVPILTNGMKFHGISVSAKDAELASALKLTQDEIFMVYGVPPAILGMTDRSAFASTEALMQFWLSRGLGFAINHIEVAFDHFFGLKGYPDEYVEFDTQALLRVAYKDRIEALARGTISGIFAPDEARNSENLPSVPGGYGKEPRVQQQVVPLSAWAKAPPATPAPPAPPSAGGQPADGTPDDGAADGNEPPTPKTDLYAATIRAMVKEARQNAAA